MSSIGSPADIESAKGKLGVLMPGLGAVSTTFIAGTLAIRKGISSPIGSLTQMGSYVLEKGQIIMKLKLRILFHYLV